MKACVLVRDFRQPIGGFESWVDNLALMLPRRGVPVILLTIGDDACHVAYPGIPTVDVALKADVFDQALEVLRALSMLAAKGVCGIFFCGGYTYIDVAGLNLRESPWLRVPVIHGRDAGYYDWACLGPPAAIVAPAPDLARVLRAELASRVGFVRALAKVKCIRHGVPIPDSRVKPPRDGPLRIAVVTRLNPDLKRPMDYVFVAEAMSRRGVGFSMTIAGDGPALPAMLERAEAAGLAGHIHFRGALPREEVFQLLQASDVLLSTSESEAFGLAIAEAMANECAVVAADIDGEVRRMLQPDCGIRIPVGDIEGFASALARLAREPLLCAAMGSAGQRRAKRFYSMERMVDDYARLFSRLATETCEDTCWTAPERIHRTPGQAVGPGLRYEVMRSIRRALTWRGSKERATRP